VELIEIGINDPCVEWKLELPDEAELQLRHARIVELTSPGLHVAPWDAVRVGNAERLGHERLRIILAVHGEKRLLPEDSEPFVVDEVVLEKRFKAGEIKPANAQRLAFT
jgi:hypothetical protein